MTNLFLVLYMNFSPGFVKVEMHNSIPGHTYSMQESTNLTDWVEIAQVPGFGVPIGVLDPMSNDLGVKIYRVKQLD